jgi:hypothetical protein
MIDTIKLGIPLTQSQHRKIAQESKNNERGQWVLFFPMTGELLFRRTSGRATTDQHSYHRDLRWDIPANYFEGCHLTIEFSIPKFWYGHNIHLLYEFMPALNKLRHLLNRAFDFKTRGVLPSVEQWIIHRVDACYAWRCPDQMTAQLYLDSLKHLRFPRKKPVIYPTAILFAGTTYSVKIYLKLPEFRQHDMQAMVKSGASLDYVNHLEDMARGVLRFEVTLRKRYLRRQKITTVADLLKPDAYLEWDEDIEFDKDFNEDACVFAVLDWEMSENGLDPLAVLDVNRHAEVADGTHFSAPVCGYFYNGLHGVHPGGGFTYRKQSRILSIQQYMLEKVVGGETQMLKADEVKAKLLIHYKDVKAGRLTAFWLYVQQFGLENAKETYGENSYYRSKRELRIAGVSLTEKPKTRIPQSKEFLTRFRMEIPSADVTNRYDDYRDRSNVLNFVPKASNL